MPEWDEATGQTVVEIARAELTEPYAVLLGKGLSEALLAEAEAITTQATKRASPGQPDPAKPFVLGASSYFVKMAGMAGRLSKSPWPLIGQLHEERFGPRS